MNINSAGYASVQTSINSGIEAFNGGTEVGPSRAAALNQVIDSFESLNLRIASPVSETAPGIKETASFPDPASFYRTLNASDPVLRELTNPAFKPARVLENFSGEIGKLLTQGELAAHRFVEPFDPWIMNYYPQHDRRVDPNTLTPFPEMQIPPDPVGHHLGEARNLFDVHLDRSGRSINDMIASFKSTIDLQIRFDAARMLSRPIAG